MKSNHHTPTSPPPNSIDAAPPVDFDDDPSIACELLVEWYSALLVALRLDDGRRHPPPESLAARAAARHRVDSVRIFVDAWTRFASAADDVTDFERTLMSEQIARVFRIAFDAETRGALSAEDLDRLRRFRAIKSAMAIASAFGAERGAAWPQ
jgi:hypothetical protein